MKVVTSKLANHTVKLPTAPVAKTVKFVNHKAIVTDDIGEFIRNHGGNFYQVKDDFSGINSESKVLVIRDTGLGDVLMVTPLLRELKIKFNCQLTFGTCKSWIPVFNGNPYIDKVVDMDSVPRNAFDYTIDLCRTVEIAEENNVNDHRVDAFGKLLDLDLSQNRSLDYYLHEDEIKWAATVLKPNQSAAGNLIAYVWSASTEQRSWSMEKHLTVLQQIIEADLIPVIFCRDTVNLDLDGIINLSGNYSVRQTAALMNCCTACLTPDTGLLHLAAAIDLPTVCYWGAFPMTERACFRYPKEFADLTVKENCAKIPCRVYTCRNWRRDQFTISPCLDVSPSEVVSQLKGVIENHEYRKNCDREQKYESRGRVIKSIRNGDTHVGADRANI